MKNIKIVLILLISSAVLFSCKDKQLNTPAYPPGNYFVVSGQRADLLKSKSLSIEKIDNSGNTISSKGISEIIEISGKAYFRLNTSWTENLSMFSQGSNRFKFVFGGAFKDDVVISATLNQEKNTVTYDAVVYNQSTIEPVTSEIPSTVSKIYTIK